MSGSAYENIDMKSTVIPHRNSCINIGVFDYNSRFNYVNRSNCRSSYNKNRKWEFHVKQTKDNLFIRNQILLRSKSIPKHYNTYSERNSDKGEFIHMKF